MSPAVGEAPTKREYFRWDSAATAIGLLIVVIFAVYFSLYLPTYVFFVPWVEYLILGYGGYLTYFVALPKFAKAIIGERTGTLATMDGVWRVSDTFAYELDPLTAKIDYAALKASGVKVPKELEAILEKDSQLPQPGHDSKGRSIPAWYVKAGGYKLSKVWYDEPGVDGFHIFVGFPPIDIGGKKRGGCLVSLCKPFAISHEALPIRWLQQLREDHMFVDGKSSVWLHVEPSPRFVEGLRLRADYWSSVLAGAPASPTGVLDIQATYALVVQACIETSRERAKAESYWKDNVELRRAMRGGSGMAASVYGRRDNRVSGYAETDNIPSEPARA